ncbi:hypothetical protein ACFZ8E_05740 [Methylobacterium sp. HMF5984]|uniref:hypothetical protein n=1 Tax=Methylobacterium sp. HMF5984 TaxID=3367370 RepID=UPI0038532FB1
MSYPALVAAIQRQAALKLAICVRLDFTSGPMLVWNGPGPLATLDPFAANPYSAPRIVWQGVGQLGSVSDIDRALVSSQTPTLTMSGVDPVVAARALAGSHEVKGRGVRIFEQYFDADTSQVVDMPFSLWTGLMDRPQIATQASQSTVTVSTVTLLYRRRRPALAYLSDSTQQALYPGDAGCSEMARLVQATENWPAYS